MLKNGRISSPSDRDDNVVTAEDWPWLVHMDQIDQYDVFGASNLGCTGTILTSSWILTSAKCCTMLGCTLGSTNCNGNLHKDRVENRNLMKSKFWSKSKVRRKIDICIKNPNFPRKI